MKKIIGIVIVAFALAACKPSNAPKYPAGADGITRMRLDSARYFMDRHNTRRAMIQLKAAEKHLPEVNEDSLKFVTYLSIAQINAQNGAYKMALTYYLGAEKHANGVKRSHRLADVFLGKAAVYNQMGMSDSASLWVKKAEKFRPRIRKDQERYIETLKKRIQNKQILAVSSDKDVEIVQIQNRYETTLAQRDALEQRLYFSYAIIALLLLTAGIIVWFRYRMRQQLGRFRLRLREIEQNIQGVLLQKNATIEEMKARIDDGMAEIEQLKGNIHGNAENMKTPESIEQIKLGINTLYTISKGGNLSQMGKKEQQALMAVMGNIDYDLACMLNHPRYALTPKETFYCIMEYNGKTEEQKAEAFCCSNQAIRSIKSRLSKKMDIGMLRFNTNH